MVFHLILSCLPFMLLSERRTAISLLLVRCVVLKENLEVFDLQILTLQSGTDIIYTRLQGLLHAGIVGGHHNANPFLANNDFKADRSEVRRIKGYSDTSKTAIHGLSCILYLVDHRLGVYSYGTVCCSQSISASGKDIGRFRTQGELILILCSVVVVRFNVQVLLNVLIIGSYSFRGAFHENSMVRQLDLCCLSRLGCLNRGRSVIGGDTRLLSCCGESPRLFLACRVCSVVTMGDGRSTLCCEECIDRRHVIFLSQDF